MKPYSAAAVQLTSTPDLDANLAAAGGGVERAARAGAALVVLPENWPFLGPEPEKLRRAPEIAERSERFLRETAARLGVDLVGGGHPVPTGNDTVLNRMLWAAPDGSVRTQYDKLHLFDADLPGQRLRESDSVSAGDRPVCIPAGPLGTVGLSICYDLRFPELYRGYAAAGADVLLIPAAFTAFTGRAHWEILVRARAIENTCYVIAAAQDGHHFADRTSHGHTLIVDPWGDVIAESPPGPGTAIAPLRPERLAEVRRILPSLQHRRV